MNGAYETLIKKDVRVYRLRLMPVVDKCNLSKVRELMNFGDAIGDWRHSNKFMFPSKSFDKKKVVFKEETTEDVDETGVVKDKWNTRETAEEHIPTNKTLIIRGEVAGT